MPAADFNLNSQLVLQKACYGRVFFTIAHTGIRSISETEPIRETNYASMSVSNKESYGESRTSFRKYFVS